MAVHSMADQPGQVRELAQIFVDSGLSVLQATCRRGAMSLMEFDAAGQRRSGGRSSEIFDLLRGLESLLRPAGEDRTLTIELRLDGSGGHEFRHTFELESVSPTPLALDPTYRYPHHPLPGMPRPANTVVTDEPTDPRTLATVRGLVNEFTMRYTKITGQAPDFGVGHSEEEIVAAETAIGVRFPEDVRALYRTIHDDMEEQGLLGMQEPIPLDAVVSEYLEGTPGSYGWDDGLFVRNPVVFDATPAGVVRRVSRDDWWITIATDRAGNWCAVDLDPTPLGKPGQLIEYGRDFHGPVGYVAESVTALLQEVVAALDAGAFEHEPGSRHLLTSRRPGTASGYRRRDLVGGSTEVAYTQVVNDRRHSPAEAVTGFEDPLDVQELYLNDTGAIDLSGLAALRNLRCVSINRASEVDLALPHHLPVESLSVDAPVADVALLAGHPTLWKLTLKALTAPVTIEPLATLPVLAYLDLSEVEVTDLERVLAFDQLRVLVLNRRQWHHLRARNAIPTGLAGAVLSGHSPLADAVEWRDHLVQITRTA